MFEPQTAHGWSLLVGVLALGGCAASSTRAPSRPWSGPLITAPTWAPTIPMRWRSATPSSSSSAAAPSPPAGSRASAKASSQPCRSAAAASEDVKDLKHLSVRVHHRVPAPMDRLRVGFPSARRGTALFACRGLEAANARPCRRLRRARFRSDHDLHRAIPRSFSARAVAASARRRGASTTSPTRRSRSSVARSTWRSSGRESCQRACAPIHAGRGSPWRHVAAGWPPWNGRESATPIPTTDRGRRSVPRAQPRRLSWRSWTGLTVVRGHRQPSR